jgi:hypothetical protein
MKMTRVRVFHINWHLPEKCKSCSHWNKDGYCNIGPEPEDLWFDGNEAYCMRYDEMNPAYIEGEKKSDIQSIGAMGDDLAWKERLLKLENACVQADKVKE